ncbi:MAG: hypothetical protein ACLRQZ_02915 [Clostridia bacterium]
MINYNKVEISFKDVKAAMEKAPYESNKVDVSKLTVEERQERTYLEKYNSFPVITLFDDLVNEYGEIPDQQFYIDWYVFKCYEWINDGKGNFKDKNEKWRKLQWTETTAKVLADRASRTYYSRMMELYIIAVIKEFLPDINIYSNPILDIYGAVDIMLFNQKRNKVIYAHVLRESKDSRNQLAAKSEDRRKFYYINPETKERHDFVIDRDFSTHTNITYGNVKQSRNINGYIVPLPIYIVGQVRKEFNRDDLQSVDNPEYLLNLIDAISGAFPEIPFIDLSKNDYSLVS